MLVLKFQISQWSGYKLRENMKHLLKIKYQKQTFSDSKSINIDIFINSLCFDNSMNEDYQIYSEKMSYKPTSLHMITDAI